MNNLAQLNSGNGNSENVREIKELVEEVMYLEQQLVQSKSTNIKIAHQLEDAHAAITELKTSNAQLAERLFEFENGSAVRSLKQMLIDQQTLYRQTPLSASKANNSVDRRILNLEAMLSEERKLREQTEQSLNSQQAEIQRFRELSRVASATRPNTMTEGENSNQRDDLREEFTRVQRNNEAAVRELRASEKRYDALVNELHQVMEERDSAVQAREESKRLKSEEERQCQQQRLLADEARAARDAASDRAIVAERGRDLALTQKDAEERQRAAAMADLEMVKNQLETLVVERDSALRENERLSSRLDDALNERRAAVNAKTEAAQLADLAVKTSEEAEHRCRMETRRASENESKRMEAENRLEKLQVELTEVASSLRRAVSECEIAKDARLEADRDLEASQRQVRALNEEMKSVLKARDAALMQREEALLRSVRAQSDATSQGLVHSERVAREDRALKELDLSKRREQEALGMCKKLELRLLEVEQQQSIKRYEQVEKTPPSSSNYNTPRQNKEASRSVDLMKILQDLRRLRQMLDQIKSSIQRDAPEAPSPPRIVRGEHATNLEIGSLISQHLLSLMEVCSDVRQRVNSVQERFENAKQVASTYQKRAERLEWQDARGVLEEENDELQFLRRRTTELLESQPKHSDVNSLRHRVDGLVDRLHISESYSGFDMDIRSLHRELQAKQAEVDSLREQQSLLYSEIEQLNLRLQRVTPHRHEVEQLRERLRLALMDLERADAEISSLRVKVSGSQVHFE